MAEQSQSNSGLYRLLNFPFIYNSWQLFVGGERARATIAKKYISAKAGQRVLDIGCGTGTLFELMGKEIDYVGYDISQEYIDFAKNKYKDTPNARFYFKRVNEIEMSEKDFDVVIAIGILHHLNDDEALKLIELAFLHLKEGGRFVLAEPAWIPKQNLFAKFMLKMDRGKAIRDVEGYKKLLQPYFKSSESTIDGKLFNVPYTMCMIEAIR
jgi:2-polyprenyl-3-methyl-5-hydroxy-6-metoxy-1,4-benzoquinol methylase